jgi:hypothetical protein
MRKTATMRLYTKAEDDMKSKTPTHCPTCGKPYTTKERYALRHGISVQLQDKLDEALREIDKRFNDIQWTDEARAEHAAWLAAGNSGRYPPVEARLGERDANRLAARRLLRAEFKAHYGAKKAKPRSAIKSL